MSIRLKMTLWYTLLSLLIMAFVLSVMLNISDKVAKNQAKSVLKSVVDVNATEVWYQFGELETGDFDEYDNGVYLQIYDDTGVLLKGYSPISALPDNLENEAFREIAVNGSALYFYSVRVTDESEKWPPFYSWPSGASNVSFDGQSLHQSVWVCGILPAERLDNVLSSVIRLTFITLPALLFLIALGGWFIATRSLAPVRKLTESAREISNGDDLSRRVEIGPGKDEIHTLADTFNAMFARLERSFQAEKQFTSDASHELRTPTAIILAECDSMKHINEDPAELRESLNVIERQAKKMAALVSRLLMFTRLDQGRQKTQAVDVDLSILAEAVCEEQGRLAEQGITVETDIQPDVIVNGDDQLLLSLLQNLVSNAWKYGKENGHVWVTMKAENSMVRLTVRDDGIGMTQEQLAHIWDRFYQANTARTNRDGSLGLGLSMVKEIVRLHRGQITAESEYGKGSTFSVLLPILTK
ncbi:MAG: HAMP domain-containing histidine kinase [Clostridia bacterium]|nr:HAMP domain-containing histidine kinase [Clostridia bacterium]